MVRILALIAVAVALVGNVGSAQVPGQGDGAPLNYDTFMQMDVQSRLATFDSLGPEDRADLVHTQIERWAATNRDRLSPEQLGLVQEWLMVVVADNYRWPRSEALAARLSDIQVRSRAVFTSQDILDATSIRGAYFPAKP
jgi:hypothetical protein